MGCDTNGVFPGTTPEAARWFAAHGCGPVRLWPRTKKVVQGRRKGAAKDEKAPLSPEPPDLFEPTHNIGVAWGEHSGGKVDADLDVPESLAAARFFLPATSWVWGRRSARRSHHIYRVENPPELASDKYLDPCCGPDRKATLIEVRSTGGQTMAPPSRHPDVDEIVEWDTCEGEPAAVPLDDLRAAVRATAAAALLGRYWPTGARHDAALALAGGLLRGWNGDVPRAERFVEAVCAAAGDGEVRNRLQCVADTAESLRDGDQATGWRRLAKLLGGHGMTLVRQVCEWLDLDRSPAAPAAPAAPEWPDAPHGQALYGLAGDVVRAVEPHTEADPTAVLLQFLIAFGNRIGRHAHFRVEADRHYTNEFAVIVGRSGKGRKGTSWGQTIELFRAADPASADDLVLRPAWADSRVASGLSSGEGLIWAVRDPVEGPEKVSGERGQPPCYQTVVKDHGEADKRLMAVESEFASVLKQTERQGNTLSVILRQAWETGTLRTLTKNIQNRATGAHVSIIGHITEEELKRYLTETETANGFGNRFLWVAARRSKLLPEGGRPDAGVMAELAGELREAIRYAGAVGEMTRDPDARAMWHEMSPALSADRPGLAGSLLGRAEAHTLRLSMLYALLDRSDAIRPDHLAAASSVWDYCERSVKYLFGDCTGDPVADDLLRLIRANKDAGITRTDISGYLGRNVTSDRMSRALGVLLAATLAHKKDEPTGGRPTERWFPGPGRG